MTSYIGPTLWLTGVWIVLWRSTTPATLITGVVLAVLLTWAIRSGDENLERHRVRPVALVRSLAHMVVALVRANAVMAREVLTRDDHTRPGILEVQLPACSELVMTIIANSITLTPGSVVLDLRMETSTLSIHVLHLQDVDAWRAEIEVLHRLVSSALVHVPTTQGASR
jgi:multicomponent Na+:H+ antiporter subunit E